MVVQAYEYEKEHLLPKDEAAKLEQTQANADHGEDQKEENTTTNETSSSSSPPAAKKLKTHVDVRTNVCLAPLRGFFSSTRSSMKTPIFRRLDAEVRERREKLLQERGWSVTKEERQEPAAAVVDELPN